MIEKRPSSSVENFKKALSLAEQQKEQALFVFDMDSTLFCMKYRTQAIIKDILKDEEFNQRFSKEMEQIQKVLVTEKDWSIREIMSRYGFSETEPVVLAIEKIWRKNFFINKYLDQDKPYKGCVSFVQKIAQTGAQVYYLTARNKKAMYEGTVQSLHFWNFPLKTEENLIMKEEEALDDAAYKEKHLRKLALEFETILFFENEPVIVNRVAESLPQIHLFWMDSTHSRREKPPKKAWPVDMDYSIETL